MKQHFHQTEYSMRQEDVDGLSLIEKVQVEVSSHGDCVIYWGGQDLIISQRLHGKSEKNSREATHLGVDH